MSPIGVPFLILLSIAGAVVLLWLLVKLFQAVGWLLGQVFRFLGHVCRFFGDEVADVVRTAGGALTSIFLLPPILWNILFGRWTVAEHYGRAFEEECIGVARRIYRIAIGNPARLFGLSALTEGLEGRLPEVVRRAPREGASASSSEFDGYRVLGTLPGGGSGARLFLAEPTREKLRQLARTGAPLPRQVVVKAFSLEDGSSLSQIVRESRSLEAARKLGLVLDHRLEERRYYYVMPFVPGKDLSIVTRRLHAESGADGLDDARLSEAVAYVCDVLETLDRFHRNGLWHKDIKPSNVIVSDGRAHLVDFGLITPLRSAMTLTTHGTEYFRDPEMVRLALQGVKVHEVDGVKFDVYGAGAVLFSLVENSFPAHGSLSRVTKRCPEALQWIVRRAMADMSARYASAHEMLGDLHAVASARDPFGVRPADLPSVQGRGDVLVASMRGPGPDGMGNPWPSHPPVASAPVRGHGRTRRHRPRSRRLGPGVLVAGFLSLFLGCSALLALLGAAPVRLSRRQTPPPLRIETRLPDPTHAPVRPRRPDDRVHRSATPAPRSTGRSVGDPASGAVVGDLLRDGSWSDATAAALAAGTVLVLDDLAPNADAATRGQVRALEAALRKARWSVLGLGGDDDLENLDLLALARSAAGLGDPSDPEAADRLSQLLDAQDAEIRAILWLSGGSGEDGARCRLVTRGDTSPRDPELRPLLELLRPVTNDLR